MKNIWANLPIPMPAWAPDGDGAGAGAGDGAGADNKAGAGDKGGGDGAGAGDKGAGDGKGGAGDGAGKTAADDTGDGDGEGDGDGDGLPGAADWPDDWRERLAGGDEKKLAELKRVTDPTMLGKRFFDSLEAARKKGGGAAVDLNAPPPEDAEELKTWRAARGVPEEATGYEVPKEVAEMVTDEDKPMVSAYFEKAHKEGLPKRAAEWAVREYFELRDSAIAQEAGADKEAKGATTSELKKDWGPEYKANNALAREMVKKLGEDAETGDWFAARLPDGRLLGNVPGFVKVMAQMGKREFGDEAFAGDANTSATKSRKEELLTIMKSDIKRWNSSPDLRNELFKINEAEARRNGQNT